MAGIMQASDADNFLIHSACPAIKTISIVETTTVSWRTMRKLSNKIRSLIELAAYIRECPIKINAGERYFLHTSVRRSVCSNYKSELSGDSE